MAITDGPTALRQGDVGAYAAEARRSDGSPVRDQVIHWAVVPAEAGFADSTGQLVGYEPGSLRLVATAGAAADTQCVVVTGRDGLTGSFQVVGHGAERNRYTSDLWLHGGAAYTGTWGLRQGAQGALRGDRLYAWDITAPGAIARTDSVAVDASTVNDVKIHPEGALTVLSHEGSADGLNGITILDTSDPHHPQAIARFTDGLEPGVHNLWVEGSHVYAVSDGVRPQSGSGMQVIDISNPAEPRAVAHFFGGMSGRAGHFLHDIYVRDGLAFLSHWSAGLIILDVGHGIAGGSPANPVEVSRIMPRAGPGREEASDQVHNAWYWPETGYVFIGEEDFSTPGRMHVVDASDLRRPRYVASYRPRNHLDTPHNFWLDEERGILYMAWYSQGLRALDVSGELLGELERQDREIASILYDGPGACGEEGTCTWAPQLHQGLVFVADQNSGIWALEPDF